MEDYFSLTTGFLKLVLNHCKVFCFNSAPYSSVASGGTEVISPLTCRFFCLCFRDHIALFLLTAVISPHTNTKGASSQRHTATPPPQLQPPQQQELCKSLCHLPITCKIFS